MLCKPNEKAAKIWWFPQILIFSLMFSNVQRFSLIFQNIKNLSMDTDKMLYVMLTYSTCAT